MDDLDDRRWEQQTIIGLLRGQVDRRNEIDQPNVRLIIHMRHANQRVNLLFRAFHSRNIKTLVKAYICLLYTSPSPRD